MKLLGLPGRPPPHACTMYRMVWPWQALDGQIEYHIAEATIDLPTVALPWAGQKISEAAVWRGLRQDNPVAGLKAPKDRTERAERIKYLPLDGLRRLLAGPADGMVSRGGQRAAEHVGERQEEGGGAILCEV